MAARILAAVVLAYLAYAGHARRVQTESGRLQSEPPESSEEVAGRRGLSSFLLASNFALGVHPSPSSLAHEKGVAEKPMTTLSSLAAKVTSIRGGGTPSMTMSSILKAFAMPSLLGGWCIAIVPCALAYFRQAYVFSLSYGLATAAIGASVLSASCPVTNTWVFTHAALVLGYGVRLFLFLLWRQVGQDAGYGGPTGKLAKLDKTPRAKRTSLIISTALFYSLMCSPLLYHAQVGTAALGVPFGKRLIESGVVLAGFGLFIEALADLQKSLFKIRLRAEGAADRLCTEGLYAVCRHPNYLGEILFWIGSFVLGLPAIISQTRAMPLHAVFSGLGLLGILSIMLSATKRLDGRQESNAPEAWPQLGKDGEPDSYAKYKARTFKLFPWQRS